LGERFMTLEVHPDQIRDGDAREVMKVLDAYRGAASKPLLPPEASAR
jgi:hypothetical protein